MATERLEIQLTGKDGVSRSFVAIGKSANQMGAELERAGTRGSKALSGMKGASIALGGSATVLAGALSNAARAAAEEEVVFQRLEQQVENTGEGYEKYASQIETAIAAGERMSFADDQTAEALTRLTSVTNDAGEALKLLGTAQDLARAKGIDLASASTIVGKVAAGNVGILQRYGIAVSEGATAQQALAEVQTRFAGQAEAYASTTQGAVDRVKNAIDNFTESIGENTGGLQTTLALLPGVSAAYTLVGASLGPLIKSATTARVAMGALALATGPVGLVVGAVAAAGAIAYLALKHGDQETATQAATRSVRELTVALLENQAAGAKAGDTAWGQAMILQFEEVQQASIRMGDAIAAARIKASSAETQQPPDISAIKESREALEALERSAARYVLTTDQANSTTADMATIMAYTGENVGVVRKALANTLDEFQRGEISATGYANSLTYIAKNATIWGVVLRDATTAVEESTEAWERHRAAEGVIRGLTGQSARYTAQAEAMAAAERDFQRGMQGSADRWTAMGVAIDEATTAAIAWAGQGENIVNLLLEMDSAAGATGNAWLQLADNIGDSGRALDAALAIFSGIDALGTRTETAAGIVDKLFGPDGNAFDGVGPLRDQLDQARISQEEFNDAVASGVQVQETNAEVQADLNTIRIKQIPLLEDQSEAYWRDIDALSKLGPLEAQRVIAMQDAGVQAQIATAYSTALSASLGEMGLEGEAAATTLITGMTEANPVLKGLLEDLGLIEVDREGKVSVVFPEADKTTQAIDNLTDAIDGLYTLINNGIPPVRVEVDDQASGPLEALTEKFKAFNTAANEAAVDKFIGLGGGGGASQFPITTTGSRYTAEAINDPGPVIPKWSVASLTPPPIVFTSDITDPAAKREVMLGFIAELTAAAHVAEFSGDDSLLEAVVEHARPLAESMSDIQTTTHFGAEAEEFLAVYGNASILADSIDGKRVLTHVDGEATGATGAVQTADGSLRGIDGRVASTSIVGYDYTASAVNSAHGNLNSIDGRTATTYIDTIYRQSGATAFQHGGTIWADKDPPNIPRAQHGRTVLVGEAGPELVNLPHGSRVTPHGASMSQLAGGGDVHLNVYGNVYGVDDLMSIVTDRLVPILVSAADNHTRGLGQR